MNQLQSLCFSGGPETASVTQNSGGVRKRLPKYRSYHPFPPLHRLSHKKRYVFSGGIRIWLWFFPSSWGLLTASVWQSSSPWTEISPLLSCHFGSGIRERNSFWHICSWNEVSLAAGGSLLCLPFLLPDLMRLLMRRWDQMSWHSHLPYMVLREGRTCVEPLGCSCPVLCRGFLRNLGFWSTPCLRAGMSKGSHIPGQIHVLFEYCFQKSTSN